MYSTVQGALTPPMQIAVTEDGTAENISDATDVKLHWLKPDGTTVDVDLTPNADLGGLAAGQLQRDWTAGDTDVPGYHRGRVTMNRGGTTPEVFPSEGWIYWLVTMAVPDPIE